MGVLVFPMMEAVKSRGALGVAERVLTVVGVYPGMFVAPGAVFLTPFLLSLRAGWGWPVVLGCGVLAFGLLVFMLGGSLWNLAVIRSLRGGYSFDHLLFVFSALFWLAVLPLLTAGVLGVI